MSEIDEVPIVDITGIMMENNSITIPVEIFNNAAVEPGEYNTNNTKYIILNHH